MILVLLFLLWPWIARWLRGFMARRAENLIRRMAGMPPRNGGRTRAKNNEGRQRRYGFGRRKAARTEDPQEGIRSMREYAEDVEFTEIREYSSDEMHVGDGAPRRERRIYREEQVSDAEYTEIRTKE